MTPFEHVLIVVAFAIPFIHFMVAERFYYRVRDQWADLDDKLTAIMDELEIEKPEQGGPKR